jgi:hypothetical protein
VDRGTGRMVVIEVLGVREFLPFGYIVPKRPGIKRGPYVRTTASRLCGDGLPQTKRCCWKTALMDIDDRKRFSEL